MRSDRVPRDGAAALRLCLPGLPRRAVVDCATPVIVLAPRPRDHDPGGPDSGVPRVGTARHFFLGEKNSGVGARACGGGPWEERREYGPRGTRGLAGFWALRC